MKLEHARANGATPQKDEIKQFTKEEVLRIGATITPRNFKVLIYVPQLTWDKIAIPETGMARLRKELSRMDMKQLMVANADSKIEDLKPGDFVCMDGEFPSKGLELEGVTFLLVDYGFIGFTWANPEKIPFTNELVVDAPENTKVITTVRSIQ